MEDRLSWEKNVREGAYIVLIKVEWGKLAKMCSEKYMCRESGVL